MIFAAQPHSRRAALLRRREGPHGRLGRDPDHLKILPGASSSSATPRGGAGEARAPRQPGALRQRHRRRCRCARPTMCRASIRTARCRRSRKPTPARAGANAGRAGAAREPDRAATGAARSAAMAACRWSARRRDRRQDGGMARGGRLATGSTSCSRPARRARRFRRQGRAGIAAARPVPAGYEGTTLREHLGLPRPDNRFFEAR